MCEVHAACSFGATTRGQCVKIPWNAGVCGSRRAPLTRFFAPPSTSHPVTLCTLVNDAALRSPPVSRLSAALEVPPAPPALPSS